MNRLATKKERTNQLALRRHHLHPPGVAGQLRDGHQVVIVNELDRFQRQFAYQVGLLARLDVERLHILERLHPIVAVAKLARRAFHLGFTPRVLLVGDLD